MFNGFLNLIGNGCGAGLHGLSLPSIMLNTVSTESVSNGWDVIGLIASILGQLLYKFVYAIVSFLLSILDFIQFAIYKIMGIGSARTSDYVVVDNTNPLVKMLTNDVVIRTFGIIVVVAIVLIILFTIFSIVVSEYKAATADGDNTKSRIFGRSLRTFLILGLFPALLVAGVILTNALLAGFNNVFSVGGYNNASLGSTLFVVSSKDANKYRMYAENNVRIPILIDFDDPYGSKGNVDGYTTNELKAIYNSFDTTGKELYSNFAYDDFPEFKDTVVYKNNSMYNSSSYQGYEKFVCTPEQYYVMADFIEYAFSNHLEFYIKSVKDADIDWKYVDSTIFNRENKSLTITYKDASGVAGNNSHYSVYYIPTSLDISTPISDAFDTISNILAIGDYADNRFNIMNRDDSSINIVNWETDKVYLKLSADYSNPTYTDCILLYEFYRYNYNNTLGNNISNLENGLELPALLYERKEWMAAYQRYVTTYMSPVVEINNHYYKLVRTDELTSEQDDLFDNNSEKDTMRNKKDCYGDYYYTIMPLKIEETTVMSRPVFSESDKSDTYGEGNSIKIESLGGSAKYLNYTKNETFSDLMVYKLNGSFSNTSYNDEGYAINSYSYYNDSVERITKKVNWPQKIINDLQTIYSDINVNLLLSSGNWLEKLSEIRGTTSTSTEYGQSFDTSLIHPLGLIMSELFLNEVASSRLAWYGDYEFTSSLNEQDIKALLLAVCGENAYKQLNAQLTYFVDMFNALFEPVLENIAYKENFDLLSGNLASEQLYTYKAYLCSVLLSSSCAQYLFNVSSQVLGANEFAYGLLKYENIVEQISDEIIEETDNEHKNTDPLYLYVTISKDDYAEYVNKTKDLFNNVFNTGEYDYSTFVEEFGKIPDCNETYIKDKIMDTFDFSIVPFNVSTDDVIARILERLVVFVDQCARTSINNIVTATYRKYSELSSTQYLDAVYKAISTEMGDQGLKTPKGDYEYMYVLDQYIHDGEDLHFADYVNGYLSARWDVIQRADATNAKKLVGSYGAINDELDDFMDKLGDVDSYFSAKGFSGFLKEIFLQRRSLVQTLTLLYNDLKEYDKNADDETKYAKDLISPVVFMEKVKGEAGGLDGIFTEDETIGQAILDFLGDITAPEISYVDDSGTVSVSGTVGVSDYIYFFEQLEKIMDIAGGNLDIKIGKNNVNKDDVQNATIYLKKVATMMYDYSYALAKIDFNELKEFNEAHNTTGIETYRSVEKYTAAVAVLHDAAYYIESYLNALNKKDILAKYYLTYGVSSYVSAHINTDFDVVVGNKHYTVGSNLTSGKLAEYVLGGKFLSQFGYGLNFVDDDYEGLLQLNKKTDITGDGGALFNYEVGDNFTYLRDFLIKFGDVAANLYNISNFTKLSGNAYDEIVIEDNVELVKMMLKYILDNDFLSSEIVASRFFISLTNEEIEAVSNAVVAEVNADIQSKIAAGETIEPGYKDNEIKRLTQIRLQEAIINNAKAKAKDKVNDAEDAKAKELFESVYGYIFINEYNEKLDFEHLTLQDIRINAINFLINYQRMNETDQDNQNRFMTLFNLACADWVGANNDNDYNKGEIDDISGIATNNGSMGIVLKLAGIENRPYEELIDLEYTIDFDTKAVDEANGDIFVICLYDEETYSYVPFMMTNKQDADGKNSLCVVNDTVNGVETKYNWLDRYGYIAATDYYTSDNDNNDEVFYPVIARGVFDGNNRPTAIRRNGDDIEFYRDDVVIRNASSIGLSIYYLSIEDMNIKTGVVGTVVNFFTKVFTGKSLTERLVEKIPRLAIESDLNFAYGVDTRVVDGMDASKTIITFTFGEGSLSFGSLYDSSNINIFLLFIVTIVVFMFVFRAFWGVIGRVIDITWLFILGPFAISTLALKTDTKDKGGYKESSGVGSQAFDKWKQTMIDKVLLAFGYVFGLNIFFVLAPMVSGTRLFSDTTINVIRGVPLFGSMSLTFANAIGMMILLVALSSMITYSVKLFSKVFSITDAFSYGASVQGNVKSTIKEVQDVISGQKLVDDVHDTIESVKKSIPGAEFIKSAAAKIKKAKNELAYKALEAAAVAYGVPPDVAKKALAAYKKAEQKKETEKKERAEKRKKERDERDKMRDSFNKIG